MEDSRNKEVGGREDVVQGQVWRIRTSKVSYDCNRQNQKTKFETYRVELREQWKEIHYQPYE